MQINLATDYALKCLLFLSGEENGVSSNQISSVIGIEREYTLKILRILKLGGLIQSRQGKQGGYALARPLDRISVLQVLQCMDDAIKIPASMKNDENAFSGIYHFFSSWQKKTEQELSTVFLSQL